MEGEDKFRIPPQSERITLRGSSQLGTASNANSPICLLIPLARGHQITFASIGSTRPVADRSLTSAQAALALPVSDSPSARPHELISKRTHRLSLARCQRSPVARTAACLSLTLRRDTYPQLQKAATPSHLALHARERAMSWQCVIFNRSANLAATWQHTNSF